MPHPGYPDGLLSIHPTAQVSELADLERSQRGSRIVIGAGCRVDSFVKIKPSGGCGDVQIGERCYLNSGCVLYSGNGISIGNDVLIAANCTLAPVNHAFKDRNRLIREQGFSATRGGIVIEDDVWIGANCVLLDGALLRRGCVVAAGSVVRGELPAYSISRGIPAVPVDERR
jgi:acetyltransferase-like isoleucine patch superfamily enzyme